MSAIPADPVSQSAPEPRPSADGRSLPARLLRNPQAVVCVAYLLFVVFLGLSSPWLAPIGPNVTNLSAVNAAPFSPHHLLGGDGSGRDILSRLMWGTRETLLACVIVLAVSVVLGVTSGLIAGFYRGRLEAALNWVSDVFMSMPGIVLLIALYARTGPNIPVAMAVFGLLIAPSYFRIVRTVVVSVRNELYVDAAKVSGLSDMRIIGRHVLWAVRGPVVIQSSFVLAAGIGIEAGVDFLGLGNPAQPSWGTVMQEAFNNMYDNAASVLWPALLISLTILALILLGNSLRDVLQSSTRGRPLTARQRRELIREAATPAEQEQQDTSSEGNDVALAIRGLRVAYPDGAGGATEVVHGIDLDIRRGEIHGLVGESGSGKSQIAFATLGILPKEALVLGGSIVLGGHDLLAGPRHMQQARGRRVAYIPQEPMSNLDPSFTVGAQLTYGLRAAKPMSKNEAREELLRLLARVGIKDPERVFGLYPHQLSGGMAQRVLICGAVAASPDVIIADEPTTALDVTVQAEVLELLRELRDERGISMLLVTHNLGVVADICDSVTVMKEGVFVEHNAVDALFASPADPYTQDLLAASRRVELAEV